MGIDVISIILAHWQSQANNSRQTTVLPDGCRDLICKQSEGAAPVWFVTDVAGGCDLVDMKRGDCYNGFRLRPGVQVDQARLLASLDDTLTEDAIINRLHSCVSSTNTVTEALSCLSGDAKSVAQAAADLGVQTRSLQRLLKQETGRAPAFWLRLARVRCAASKVAAPRALADLAYDLGYADQAHMTREFRHWLGATPRQIRRDASWAAQHMGPGYGV